MEGDASVGPSCVEVLLGEVPASGGDSPLAFAGVGVSLLSLHSEEESVVSVHEEEDSYVADEELVLGRGEPASGGSMGRGG